MDNAWVDSYLDALVSAIARGADFREQTGQRDPAFFPSPLRGTASPADGVLRTASLRLDPSAALVRAVLRARVRHPGHDGGGRRAEDFCQVLRQPAAHEGRGRALRGVGKRRIASFRALLGLMLRVACLTRPALPPPPQHRATSARNLGEKDARLEYLSWRVWNMKRMRDAGKVRRVKEWRAEPADLTTGAALEVEAEDEVEGDSEEEEVAPLASPAVAVERAQRTEVSGGRMRCWGVRARSGAFLSDVLLQCCHHRVVLHRRRRWLAPRWACRRGRASSASSARLPWRARLGRRCRSRTGPRCPRCCT